MPRVSDDLPAGVLGEVEMAVSTHLSEWVDPCLLILATVVVTSLRINIWQLASFRHKL